MYDVSKNTLDELKVLRKFCLIRYTQTDPSDTAHTEWGKLADTIGLELNRRTNSEKWKR